MVYNEELSIDLNRNVMAPYDGTKRLEAKTAKDSTRRPCERHENQQQT